MDSDSDFESITVSSSKRIVPEDNAPTITGNPIPIAADSGDPRHSYLITYSRIDVDKFPSRESFAKACVTAFGGAKRVSYYACCLERHADGAPHYHVCIKLAKAQRWSVPKQKLQQMGATVNFSEGPVNADGKYAWIYRYVSKSDKTVFHCQGHPSLHRIVQNNQRVTKALEAGRKKRKEPPATPSTSTATKATRLSNSDVSDYCREKQLKTFDEVLADAETRRLNGDTTLSTFVLSKTVKSMTELVETTWRMEKSVTKVRNLKLPRMEALKAAFDGGCVEGCNGLWFRSALEVLQKSSIDKYAFADAIRLCLKEGRGKGRNVFLSGPTNSAKTFLLKPVALIYPETFANPAASSFSWVGAEETRVIWLNDYRWHTKMRGGNIDWSLLLNLLEGTQCNLPAPKNWYAKDICIEATNTVSIFATGPRMIEWYAKEEEERRGPRHDEEDTQMKERWSLFEFTHQFKGSDRNDKIEACPSCFGHLAYLGESIYV